MKDIMKQLLIALVVFPIVGLSVNSCLDFIKNRTDNSKQIEKYVVLPQSINLALSDSSIYKNLSNGDTLYRYDPDTALWRGYRYTIKIDTLGFLEIDSIWWRQIVGIDVPGR